MNPIRLEIIQDDAMAAPRLSRVPPAVLYNYVPETLYFEFCSKINELLSLAAVDYQCRAYRLQWWTYGNLFWVYWFFVLFSILFVEFDSDVNSVRRLVVLVSIVICPISMIIIWGWLISPTGVEPATDTVRRIREECEAMTYRTPYASFHLTTSPLYMTCRAGYLCKNPIESIDVSVSAARTGLDLGNAHSHPIVNTTSAVTSDYRPLEVV